MDTPSKWSLFRSSNYEVINLFCCGTWYKESSPCFQLAKSHAASRHSNHIIYLSFLFCTITPQTNQQIHPPLFLKARTQEACVLLADTFSRDSMGRMSIASFSAGYPCSLSWKSCVQVTSNVMRSVFWLLLPEAALITCNFSSNRCPFLVVTYN